MDCKDHTIRFHIRPANPNGVLLFLRGESSSLLVELDNLHLHLTLNNRTGIKIEGPGERLTVGTWSKVTITVNTRALYTVKVDSNPAITYNYTNREGYGLCVNRHVSVGGYRHMLSSPLPNSKTSAHFKGCLRQLEIYENRPLEDASKAVHADFKGVSRWQRPLLGTTCEDRLLSCEAGEILLPATTSAVTFHPWSFFDKGEVQFILKTDVPNSVVLSSHGMQNYIYLLLRDGQLCAIANASKPVEACVGSDLADGLQHTVVLTKMHHNLVLSVDGQKSTVLLGSDSDPVLSRLHLSNEVTVGRQLSTCRNSTQALVSRLPVAVQDGYRGCVSNVMINGICASRKNGYPCASDETVVNNGEEEDPVGGYGNIMESCSQNWCDVNPCLNGGDCVSRVTQLGCNCVKTGYRGDRCAKGRSPYLAPVLHL